MKKFLFLLAVLPFATPAHAHFLWAQTNDADHSVSLYFGEGGEGIIQGVKPEMLQKVALWTPNGKRLAPKLSGGAYRAPFTAQVPVYGAYQSWGVLDRREGGRGIFRLEYYAKAATNLDKAGYSAKLPFEFFARRVGNEALVTLKRDGKNVSNTEVTVTTPQNDKGTKFQTDAQGQLHFPLTQSGHYRLRAVVIDDVPGVLDGRAYPQTRTWTTLTFEATGVTADTTNGDATTPVLQTVAAPLATEAMGNPKADPRAYALLKAAHDNRQVMLTSFPGFEADLIYRDGGVTKTGKLVYRRAGETTIKVDGLSKDDQDWLEDKTMNLIGHRRGGTFAQGDGKNPLTLVAGDVNTYGQLIKLNDGMQSEYRVKDGKVTEVTRTAGGVKFTITVIEFMEADKGKYLANHFAVAYRDEKTNQLQMVEGYHDDYTDIDGVWIPTERVVLETSDKVSPRMREIIFRNIKLLKPTQVAAATH